MGRAGNHPVSARLLSEIWAVAYFSSMNAFRKGALSLPELQPSFTAEDLEGQRATPFSPFPTTTSWHFPHVNKVRSVQRKELSYSEQSRKALSDCGAGMVVKGVAEGGDVLAFFLPQ